MRTRPVPSFLLFRSLIPLFLAVVLQRHAVAYPYMYMEEREGHPRKGLIFDIAESYPGGPLERVANGDIIRFENLTSSLCEIDTSDIPRSGYHSGKDYTINIRTSIERPSGNGLGMMWKLGDNADIRHTFNRMTHAEPVLWTAPNRTAENETFYAVCAAGRPLSKAYVAKSVMVHRHGTRGAGQMQLSSAHHHASSFPILVLFFTNLNF